MHVHIAWQIYHHQQKVKVSLAFLVWRGQGRGTGQGSGAWWGGGGQGVISRQREEAVKQFLKTHWQEGSSLSCRCY